MGPGVLEDQNVVSMGEGSERFGKKWWFGVHRLLVEQGSQSFWSKSWFPLLLCMCLAMLKPWTLPQFIEINIASCYIDGIWVMSTMLGIVQQRRRFRTRPNIRIACCNFLGRQAWLVVSKLLLFSLVACPSPSDPTVVGVCIPSLMLVSSSTFAD